MPKESPREIYAAESTGSGWFVGIIVALALLAIGYLVFPSDNCHSDVCSAVVEKSE